MRTSGAVRFYLENKLYGFLNDDAGLSYFVHANELSKAGLKIPPDSRARYPFDVEQTAKGLRAVNLAVEA